MLLQFEELGKNRGSERSVRGIEVRDEEEEVGSIKNASGIS